MSKSKSILLQVAFKAAVAMTPPRSESEVLAVQELTEDFYSLLLSLHDKYGIAITDTPTGGGNRARRPSSTPNTTDEGIGFLLDGVIWRDFRTAKDQGRVKPKFPDFKSVDGEPVWMIDQEGNAVPKAAALVAAADGAVATATF